MEYSSNYNADDILSGLDIYYNLLVKINPSYFSTHGTKNYLPKDIQSAIQIGHMIKKSGELLFKTRFPTPVDPISDISFYQEKEIAGINQTDLPFISMVIYKHIIYLAHTIVQYSLRYYTSEIEKAVTTLDTNQKISFLIKKKQAIKYDQSHPSSFKEEYEQYLKNRIQDFQELAQVENENYSIEVKEIIKSYKQGLKININGKTLLTPY